MYNGILVTHRKSEKKLFAATWMDLETVILSEVNQKEKETKYDITNNWNFKKDTNKLIYKTETDKIQKINLQLQGGRREP